MANDRTPVQPDTELLLTRIFHAPRELVWQAWTQPEQIAKWWGPRGFSTKVTEYDMRPGGRWRYVMVGEDGSEFPVTGVFQEIVPLERIVTSDDFDEGFVHDAPTDLPRGVILTILFEPLNEHCRVTLRIAHRTAADRRKHEEMGVVPGWNSSFDRLDGLLATNQ